MNFSDAQLKAYLAGDLAVEEAQALEEAIAMDDALEARLLAFDRAMSAPVKEAFDALDIEERLAPQVERVMTPPSVQQVKVRSAVKGFAVGAAAAAVAVGVFLGTLRPEAEPMRWQEQVAVYQALYVTDTLAPISATPDQVAHQLARSEAALGRSLPSEAVQSLDGLGILRAQVLGVGDLPLIQMAYLSETGAPVAFCVIKLAGDPSAGVASETLSGLPSVHWSDGSYSYMIVGDLSDDRLRRMAEDAQARL